MNSFKLQAVKLQPLLPATTEFKPLPKLNVNIQSIVCLNYPIQTLIQVLSAHFDDQPCAANLVVKALKVISISLKDKQLRTNVESILSDNLHRRERIYTLFVYWSSFITNLMPILAKIDLKLVENLLGCAISVYIFTECGLNEPISAMIANALSQLSPESYVKVSQYIKNQFMSMDYPIRSFIANLHKLRKKNERIIQFFNEIGTSIIKSRQAQQNLRQYLKQYFKNSDERSKIEEFFTTFPNLISYFISNLCSVLQQSEILQIWSTCGEHRMEAAVKSAIKEWASKRENYWRVFSANFNRSRAQESEKFQKLLELGYELDEDSIVPKFMVKQHLLNYFQGIDFSISSETQILQNIASNKERYKKMHSIGDTMSDMIKSFTNMQKQSGVTLIIMNKVHAPEAWPKTDLSSIKSNSYPLLAPFIEKLTIMFERVEKQNKEKGKKTELVFHGIKVVVSESDNKKQVIMTLSQLIKCLKSNQIFTSSLLEQYHPIDEKVKKQQVKKEVQSIVVEAKIVRVMKKSKNKLTFGQIFEEVIKQVNVAEQSCKISLDKVISKGLVELESDEFYAYCP